MGPASPSLAEMEGATAEHYRSEAIRLRELADKTASVAVRARLLEVAEEYDQLAEKMERGGGQTSC
jgi:hypothetical protein